MTTVSQMIEALQIFAKYAPNEPVWADHDFGETGIEIKAALTDKEKKRLRELDWHKDIHDDSWVIYL